MLDKTVRNVMQRRKLLKAAPGTSVLRATKLMAQKNVGAVMVIDGEQLVGIFTERDVVFRVVACGLDPAKTPLADVMTAKPFTIDPDKPFGYALLLMHEKGFRHLPVLEGGKPIGIVSARSAMDPDLEEFVSEAQRREHFRAESALGH
jgi:CBS domain-containing protein